MTDLDRPYHGTPSTEPARFWSKVDRRGPDECWLWTGPRGGGGYGRFYLANGRSAAHRVAYELTVGPIPAGLQIDHLCRNRLCVNPTHLEPVTQRENIRRGVAPAAANARKTHCPNGHELSPDNIRWQPRSNGTRSRRCEICASAYWKRRKVTHPPTVIRYHTKTHCPKGHPYDEANTRIRVTDGARLCRTCNRLRMRKVG